MAVNGVTSSVPAPDVAALLASLSQTFVSRAVNLADLASPATARTNLGLASSATMTPTQLAADSAFAGTYRQPLAVQAITTTLTGTLVAGQLLPVNATAGAATYTLPAASSVSPALALAVKKNDTTSNTVTVNRAGSDLIFGTGTGVTSKVLYFAGEVVIFQSDGVSKWTIVESDLPSSAARNAFANPAGGQSGALLTKLRTGAENAVLAIVGDSTGALVTTGSWGPRFAAWLAAQFPAYTVIRYEWTVGSGYDAGTTVQTGTGAQTLRIYNGSAAAQSIQYSVTNLATLIPATPDVVIINHGHNNGEPVAVTPPSTPGFRSVLLSLVQPIRKTYPRAGIFLTTQNPETSPVSGATISLHKQHARIIAELAATEGLGLVDVMSAMLASGTSLSTYVLASDGIHPTTAGFDVWLSLVQAEFPTGTAVSARPRAAARSVESVIVPAAAFGTVQGSPGSTYAAQDQYFNNYGHVITLGDAAVHSVGSWVAVPPHWETWDIYVLWAAQSTSGGCVWQLGIWAYDPAGAGITGGAKSLIGVAGTTYTGGNFTFSPGAVAGTLQKGKIWSSYTSAGTSRDMIVTIRRIGDNGSDTMVGNAEFHALVFERVS